MDTHEEKPVTEKPERKGRGRKQGNSAFVSGFSSGELPRLTPEQARTAKDFYETWAVRELQYSRIAREWGCGR